MSENEIKSLKAGWRRVKFGDVVRQCKEKADPETCGLERYIAGDHMETDDLRLRSWGEIGSGYLGPAFHMRFKPGQVLYGSRRTYLRKVAVADFEGICANTTFVLETKNHEELLPEFLPLLMQTDAFNDFSVKNSKGSVNPYINFSDLARFEFALPPRADQEKIHRIFASMDALYGSYDDLFDAANQVVKSSTNSLLCRADDIAGAVARFSSTSEIDVPIGWRLIPASAFCEVQVTSGTTPKDGITEVDTGFPFLRVQNLTFDGSLDFSSSRYLEAEAFNLTKKTHVLAGDVLTNIVGPPLGKVSLVPDGFPESQINQAIVRFRPKNRLLGKYLTYYLMSEFAKAWLFSRSKKTSGQRNINSSTCASLPVPVPPDFLIRDVAEQMDSFLELVKPIQKRRRDLQSLRKRLLEFVVGGRNV